MSSFNWPDVTGGAVSGPVSATNNALVRFDGTTGDLLQNSVVICDDSGNVSGVARLLINSGVAATNTILGVRDSAGNSLFTVSEDANGHGVATLHNSGQNARITLSSPSGSSQIAMVNNSGSTVITLETATGSITSTSVNGATAAEMAHLSGVTSAIQTQLNARLPLAGGTMTGKITLDGDPSNSLHAATKQYVDGLVNGVKVKEGAKVSSTVDLTLSGEQTIDGVSCVAGDRVLARHQTATEENGVYVVAAGAWARAADANSAAELNNSLVTVAQGSTSANTGWYQSAEVATLDTDAVTFVQFFGAGTYTADGSTLSLSGSTFSVASGGISNTQVNASAAIDFSKLAALTSGNILVGSGSNVATSVAVTGDVTISNAGVTAIASGVIVDADVNASAAIAGTKINPDFGSQQIATMGTSTLATTNITKGGDAQLSLERTGTFPGKAWIAAGNSESGGTGFDRIFFATNNAGNPDALRFTFDMDGGHFTPTGNITTTGTLTSAAIKEVSGKVGIGAASPGAALEIATPASGTGLLVTSNSAGESANTAAVINAEGNTSSQNILVLGSLNAGVRATFRADGQVTLGSSSGLTAAHIIRNSNTGSSVCEFQSLGEDETRPAIELKKAASGTTTAQRFVIFRVGSTTTCGSITANGAGAATFTSLSDGRLKENTQPILGALNDIMRLKPYRFDYKAGGSNIGFIAQDMQEVFPDAVTAEDDDIGTLSISGWDKTSARLVAAIQELAARNDELVTRVAALEAAQ